MTRFRLKTAWLLSSLIFMLLGSGSFMNGQVVTTSDATPADTTSPWYDETTSSDDDATYTTPSDDDTTYTTPSDYDTTYTTPSDDDTTYTTPSDDDTTYITASDNNTMSTTAPADNTMSTTASVDNTMSTTASDHNTMSTTASVDNTMSTTASDHNTMSTTASDHNTMSTTASVDNTMSTTASDHNTMSTTASVDNTMSTTASDHNTMSTTAPDNTMSTTAPDDTTMSITASDDNTMSTTASDNTMSTTAPDDTTMSITASDDTTMSTTASDDNTMSTTASPDDVTTSKTTADGKVNSTEPDKKAPTTPLTTVRITEPDRKTTTAPSTTGCNKASLYAYGTDAGDEKLVTPKYSWRSRSKAIKFPGGVSMGPDTVKRAYVQAHGVVTFGKDNYAYYPNLQYAQRRRLNLLAPFWSYSDYEKGAVWHQLYKKSNIDINNAAAAVFASVDDEVAALLQRENSQDREFNATFVLIATWDEVQPNAWYEWYCRNQDRYSSYRWFTTIVAKYCTDQSPQRNTFQLVYSSDGQRSFARYLYKKGSMTWRYEKYRRIVGGYVHSAKTRDLGFTNNEISLNLDTTFFDGESCPGTWMEQVGQRISSTAQCEKFFLKNRHLIGDAAHAEKMKQLFDCPCNLERRGAQWWYYKFERVPDTEKREYIVCLVLSPVAKRRLERLSGNHLNKLCCYRLVYPTWSNYLTWMEYRMLWWDALRQAAYIPYSNKNAGHLLLGDPWWWRSTYRISRENDFEPHRYCCEDVDSTVDSCHKFNLVRPELGCNPNATFISGLALGDPHVKTLDGKDYTMNGLGEYILMQIDTDGDTFDFQGRTAQPMQKDGTLSNATVFTAFAIKQNNASAQVELDYQKTSMTIVVNGNAITTEFYDDESYLMTTATTVGVTRENSVVDNIVSVKLSFDSDISVTVNVGVKSLEFSINVPDKFKSKTRGLLGNFDGNKENDFILPNSETLANTTSERDIWNVFGKSWLVTSSDTVFTYKDNKNTLSYQNVTFTPIFLDEASKETLQDARKICGDTDDFACVFDFIATGDEAFANYSLAANAQANDVKASQDNRLPSVVVQSGQLNDQGYWDVVHSTEDTLRLDGSDPDGDSITYHLTEVNQNALSINENSGVITYTPDHDVPVSIEVQVKDAKGGWSPNLVIIVAVCPSCTGASNGVCDKNETSEELQKSGMFLVYVCNCMPPYKGEMCETQVDGCEDEPCGQDRMCTNKSVTTDVHDEIRYTCGDCPDGYVSLGNTCVDDNECVNTTAPVCSEYSECVNNVGSYTCPCVTGFRDDGSGGCLDIDECSEFVDNCEQICTNTIGHFNCSCHPGYIQNGNKCTEDNSTLSPDCKSKGCDGFCEIVNGVATCKCNKGYELSADIHCVDFDECTAANKFCSQQCTNSPTGSFTCSCESGYKLDEDKISCTKCTEFHWGNNCENVCNCNGRGSCQHVKGCVCDVGWKGAKCDQDIDECSIAGTCPGEVCVNTRGGKDCMCPHGYEGTPGNCSDIDECSHVLLNDCDYAVQDCTNSPGSYNCVCRKGFAQNKETGLCEDIDECTAETDLCSQICKNAVGAYGCSCKIGFDLESDHVSCVQSEDVCAGSELRCSDGCTLDPDTNKPTCVCDKGFELKGTENCTDIDECDQKADHLNLCSYKDGCVNTIGGFNCTCELGFRLENNRRTCLACSGGKWGKDCDNNCECGLGASTCDPSLGCACKVGYIGDKCRENVDQCSSGVTTCPTKEECKEVFGPDLCQCIQGYERDAGNICQDINECSANTDDCDQKCENIEGNYTCTCREGFTYDSATNVCSDFNECEFETTNNCGETCMNTDGGYRCTCGEGLILERDGVNCRAEKVCGSDHGCNETCAVVNGTNKCQCPRGTNLNGDGKKCDDVDMCATNPCKGGGNCNEINNGQAIACSCPAGMRLDPTGFNCEHCLDGYYGNCQTECTCVASNTDMCDKVNGTCTCNSGWNGDTCNTDIDECTETPTTCDSVVNSDCVNTDGGHVCKCQDGYRKSNDATCSPCPDGTFGQECQGQCRCHPDHASSCNKTDGSCTCIEGWTGVRCELDKDECANPADNNCVDAKKPNYICYNKDGGFDCDCAIGYADVNGSCSNVNECDSKSLNQCVHECQDTEGNFTCSCRQGYLLDPNNRFNCLDVDECASTTLKVCEHTCNNTDGNFTCGCNTGYIVDPTDRTQCIKIVSMDFNLILDYNTTCNLKETLSKCYLKLKDQVEEALYQHAKGKTVGVLSAKVHTMKKGSLIVDSTIVINEETDPKAASNLVEALFAIVENGLVINSTQVNSISLSIAGPSGSTIILDANTDKCVVLLTITTCENGCHMVSKKAQCIVSDSYGLNIPLIVGLSVGLPLAILLVAVLIYIAYIYYKKRGTRRVDSRLGHYEENTENEFVRPNSKEAWNPGDKTSDTGVLVP